MCVAGGDARLQWNRRAPDVVVSGVTWQLVRGAFGAVSSFREVHIIQVRHEHVEARILKSEATCNVEIGFFFNTPGKHEKLINKIA
jgi:hypothetical protein